MRVHRSDDFFRTLDAAERSHPPGVLDESVELFNELLVCSCACARKNERSATAESIVRTVEAMFQSS